MTESNIPVSPLHATVPQLLRATAIALVGSGALLVTTVLPAEYGLDPTGIGKVLGLTALHAPEETSEVATVEVPTPQTAVISNDAPFHTESMSLILQPGEGAEIKAQMREGESFVFSWSTDGEPVNFDMHGEQPNAGDEFSSYWRDRGLTRAHGSFIAPFDGDHGWYWSNKGSKPVTVTVRVSGFFEKLFRPE
jgi:hypothetical protein